MCEQSEIKYNDGDIVWVKLGAMFWPGKVREVDQLPEEILSGLRKKPIAAVQFFNEEKYEYVKNLDQIFMYNCRRKNEFIKKGLDKYNNVKKDSDFMDKFPKDVVLAEQLTGGDPNILSNPIFAPCEKPNYKDIFGVDKKSNSDKKVVRKRGRRSKDEPLNDIWSNKRDRKSLNLTSPSTHLNIVSSLTPSPRQITHPRFTNATPENEHEIRIRQQPTMNSRTENIDTPYKCHLCSFTTNSLNVRILHNKFHQNQPPQTKQSTPLSKGRSKITRTNTCPKSFNKSVDLPSTSSTPKSAQSVEKSKKQLKFPKPVKKTSSKRKPPKIIDENKKKKLNEEFTQKLLADWDEDDDEELDKQKHEEDNLTKQQNNEQAIKGEENKQTLEDKEKKDCFDFDDNIDSVLDSALEERAKKFAETRKMPKIGEKIERKNNLTDFDKSVDENTSNQNEEIEQKEELSITKDPENEKISKKLKTEEKNDQNKSTNKTLKNNILEDAFINLMAETTVPEVPSLELKKDIHRIKSHSSPLHENTGSSKNLFLEIEETTKNNLQNNNNANKLSPALESSYKEIKDNLEKKKKLSGDKISKDKEKFKPIKKFTKGQINSDNLDDLELDINSMPFVMVEDSSIDLTPTDSVDTQTLVLTNSCISLPHSLINKNAEEEIPPLTPDKKTESIFNKPALQRIVSSIKNQSSLISSDEINKPSTSNQLLIFKKSDDPSKNILVKSRDISPPKKISEEYKKRSKIATYSNKQMYVSSKSDNSQQKSSSSIKTIFSPTKSQLSPTKSQLPPSKIDLSPNKSQLSPIKIEMSSTKTQTQQSSSKTSRINSQSKHVFRLQKEMSNTKSPTASTCNILKKNSSSPNRNIKYPLQTSSPQELSPSQPQRPRILGSKSRVAQAKLAAKANQAKYNTTETSQKKNINEKFENSVSETSPTIVTRQKSNSELKISNLEKDETPPIQEVFTQAQEQNVEGATTYVLLTIEGTPIVIDNTQQETSDNSTNTNEGNSNSQTLFLETASSDIENLILRIDTETTSSTQELTTQNDAKQNFQQANTSQDILAAALANTNVFQSESSIGRSNDSIKREAILNESILVSSNIGPQKKSALISTHTPTNPAEVSETSLTLNQPIMSPLEVRASMSSMQVPPPAPTALDLPLTITEPAFSSLPTPSLSSDYQTSIPIIGDSGTNQETPVIETIETEVIEQYPQQQTFNYSQLSENTQVSSAQEMKDKIS